MSSGSAAADDRTPTAATHAGPIPTLALGYAPGSDASEQQIALAQKALTKNPDVIEAYTALASALLKRRRETSNAVYGTYAQDVLNAATQRDAANTSVRLLAAMILLDEHRFETAAKKARALATALPNDPTPRLILGDALLELGDYEDAADAYQEAMNLRPDLRSYNRAAHVRWLYGDFDGALPIMDLAIGAGSSRDPEGQAWCFADLGAMYLTKGDARRATASADRALSLVPNYIPAQVVVAKAHARTGETDKAIETLTAVVERRPTVEDLLLLSEWHHGAGQAELAQTRRAQAERLVDDDPRPMAHFLARHGEQAEHALALAERELLERHNIAAHDTHALALWRNGKLDEAATAIETARALGTPDPTLALHAALIDAARGRTEAARTNLNHALALDPKVDPMLVAEARKSLEDA